jgi:hypothetical protein
MMTVSRSGAFLYMMFLCFHRTAIVLIKTQKRAIARFLMFQVDLIDAQRDNLSVHTNNHKEKVKFIPQYNHTTTAAHT